MLVIILVLALGGMLFIIFEKRGELSSKNTSENINSQVMETIEETISEEELYEHEKENVLENADKLAKEGDYVAAIALIKSAMENAQTDKDYIDIYDSYYTAYKEETLKISDELANNGDYLGAYQKLEEASQILGDDSKIEEKASIYTDSYTAMVVSEASKLVSEKDYENAMAVIDKAINLFPQSQELLDEKELISKGIPERLSEVCYPYELTYCSYEDAQMGGKTYSDAFVFDSYGEAFINLKGQYNAMEFDLGHVDGSSMSDETITIILDGNVTQAIDVQAQELPKHYTILLNGATQMEIERSSGGASYAIANIFLYQDADAIDMSEVLEKDTHLIKLCPPYETKYYSEEKVVKMGGESYTNAFTLGNTTGGYAYAYFNLGGKYDSLEFDVGHIDGTNMSDVVISISLDGNVTQVIEVKATDFPKHYVIELNGATQLLIERTSGYVRCAISEAVLH